MEGEMRTDLGRCPTRQTRDERVRESLLAEHSQQRVDRAYRKAFWVAKWRKACSAPAIPTRVFPSRDREGADIHRTPTQRDHATAIVAEARSIEGDAFKISARSLQT